MMSTRDLGPVLKLTFVLVLATAGCDLPKVRCEYVAPPASPAPVVPKGRQDKLDELADLQLDIDLEIARADKSEIETVKGISQGLHELSAKAIHDHAKNAPQLLHESMEAGEEVDKTLERIARHRCAH
jgi:hypothetical protein